MEELKRLVLALQFMTRIPIPIKLEIEENDFPGTTAYFPVVGLVIGLILSGVFMILKDIFPREIIITTIIALSYILIGALHIDGFSDTFDGLFSNKNKDKMLNIMRDSRLGTNGVIAAIFMILLKIMFLSNIKDYIVIPSLIIMPVLGRFSNTFAILISKSARGGEGLGGLMIGKIGFKEISIALIISILIGYIVMPILLFFKILIAIIVLTFLIVKYISSRIGGMTGDTLGATNELSELFVLILVYLFS